jgi:hypothetical protein
MLGEEGGAGGGGSYLAESFFLLADNPLISYNDLTANQPACHGRWLVIRGDGVGGGGGDGVNAGVGWMNGLVVVRW